MHARFFSFCVSYGANKTNHTSVIISQRAISYYPYIAPTLELCNAKITCRFSIVSPESDKYKSNYGINWANVFDHDSLNSERSLVNTELS